MMRSCLRTVSVLLVGFACCAGNSQACLKPLPPHVQGDLIQISPSNFQLVLWGGQAFESLSGGATCGCAVGLPTSLSKVGCSVTGVALTNPDGSPSAFNPFTANATTGSDFGALFSAASLSGFDVFGMAGVLSTAIGEGASLKLVIDISCTNPNTVRKLLAKALRHSAILGTGPVFLDGSIDQSNPAHVGIVPEVFVLDGKCQATAAKELATFGLQKTKCLVKCDGLVAKGLVPPSACLPPYSDPTTAACIAALEARITAVINVRCGTECPRCYELQAGSCGAYGTTAVAAVEAQVDALAPTVFCDDSASPDGLSKGEVRCRDSLASTLAKFAYAKSKCLQTCRKRELAGSVNAGACNGGSVTDPKTLACIAKAEAKANALQAKVCVDAPECLSPALAGLVGVVEASVDAADPNVFCASPSGAFVGSDLP